MKIIAVDNYDRKYISDFLIAENINARYVDIILKDLNNHHIGNWYFKAVKDDYKLYVWRP